MRAFANLLRPVCAILVGVLWSSAAHAQGTKADYNRSDKLYWSTSGWVYHCRVFPHWTPDGNAFWYVSFGLNWSRQYWWVDAVAGTKVPVFDHFRLFAALR